MIYTEREREGERHTYVVACFSRGPVDPRQELLADRGDALPEPRRPQFDKCVLYVYIYIYIYRERDMYIERVI